MLMADRAKLQNSRSNAFRCTTKQIDLFQYHHEQTGYKAEFPQEVCILYKLPQLLPGHCLNIGISNLRKLGNDIKIFSRVVEVYMKDSVS